MQEVELLVWGGRFEERSEVAHTVPLFGRHGHLHGVLWGVCRSLSNLARRLAQRLTRQVRVVLPANDLGVHLVIDADVAADRLLVILQLHLNLVGCLELASLAQSIFASAVLVYAQEVLHHDSLLLLQVEVLDGLVVLPRGVVVFHFLMVLLNRRHGLGLLHLGGLRQLLLPVHVALVVLFQLAFVLPFALFDLLDVHVVVVHQGFSVLVLADDDCLPQFLDFYRHDLHICPQFLGLRILLTRGQSLLRVLHGLLHRCHCLLHVWLPRHLHLLLSRG